MAAEMKVSPGDFLFEAEQTIPRRRDEVFRFFSDPANLQQITPPWLGFHIEEGGGVPLHQGSEFTYRLKVHGVPMRWRSRISTWEPGESFTDIQLQGPYAKWHHQHTFEDAADGAATRIRDRVVYRLPMGALGRLFGGPLVRSDIRKIFAYRAASTARLMERMGS